MYYNNTRHFFTFKFKHILALRYPLLYNTWFFGSISGIAMSLSYPYFVYLPTSKGYFIMLNHLTSFIVQRPTQLSLFFQ
uniref:Uncharacterized protein n=1 Tax=Strongyloides venezuelensis TaxID=75913 RepID=A0A0K0G5C6_STRVS